MAGQGGHDPWLTRGATDTSYMVMAVPVARFVVLLPEPHIWPIFLSVWAIHTGYKLLQAMADTRGAFTVVFPVVRGTGAIFAVVGASLIFGEAFSPTQWAGVVVLLSFGAVIVATRLDKVAEAAVLRETSPVFAAVVGWPFLK